MSQAPPPLEWHPYYRDKTWLLDWLEQRGPYADLYHVRIPVARPVRLTFDDVEPSEPSVLLMTRHKAWGAAPYVGRPFVYVWYVGTDNLGRMIASESRIVYLPTRPWESADTPVTL